ncbi:hypothetical protein [Seonamhaeicola aphaedonensis]|uniref:Uncharacterized protein n=1 Tax=Seonamhaeicola aphaedonensis TaxID=1461338 RepID=A0A3D9HP08_9FLAO|nr:hypothetical protein [Seonamhaeicola aphaedonensis]RED50636.1 hypothetical protein DFQ02_101673 [Seonamhaeicola aphaedonensis]
MKESFITLKQVSLKNNCPECYNNKGLQLTFEQKIVETKFYKSITPNVNHSLECLVCNTIIYPVQWTDDIERVFEYQQKTIKPKKTSKYLKKASWIAVLFFILIAIIIAILAIYTSL